MGNDSWNTDRTQKRNNWAERRGPAVIRSDDCPPTKYEAAVAAKWPAIGRKILKEGRRCLPEVAAFTQIAAKRYNWSNHQIARKIGTNEELVSQMRRGGLVPRDYSLLVPDEIFIRLGAIAGFGMCEIQAVWQRCNTKRQYEPWRAMFPLGPRGWRGRQWPDGDNLPADYKETWNHFVQGYLGWGAQPNWHWKQFEEEMLKQCREVGMTEDDAKKHLGMEPCRLDEYWDGPVPLTVEEPWRIHNGAKAVPVKKGRTTERMEYVEPSEIIENVEWPELSDVF